jgi:hypothetical protein
LGDSGQGQADQRSVSLRTTVATITDTSEPID